MSETLFIPAGQPIPFTHWKAEEIDIPAIDVNQIRRVESEPMDITSHDRIARFWIPGPTVMKMKNGDTMMMDAQSAMLAIEGGGRFQVAYPNLEYDEPMTYEEYEAQQQQEAEDAALGWADYD